MISFAILTHNEGEIIRYLIDDLLEILKEDDEIVILDDYSTDVMTKGILQSVLDHPRIQVQYRELNGNFGDQKNYLTSLCSQPWIVNIDADESLSKFLKENIHELLKLNSDVDAIWIPRVNRVDDLTQADIDKWGWNVNAAGWINFPDYQQRIYKNKPELAWKNKVHETIFGAKTIGRLPAEFDYSLLHYKTIERQRYQNEFYEKL